MSVNKYDPSTGELTPVAGTNSEVMSGATDQSDGKAGLVPKPFIADKDKCLRGDGSWGNVSSSFTGTTAEWQALTAAQKAEYKEVVLTDDYYDESVFIGATASANGTSGLVPYPQAGDQDKVLQGKGAWGHKLQLDVVKQGNEYGYINSSNDFVPFKGQADIDAAVSAAKVGNATAADVLNGKTFTNASTSGDAGTMPDNSTRTSNGEVPGIQSNYPNEPVRNGISLQYNTGTDGVRRFAMAPPKGYYPGSASYVGVPSQTKTCTPSTSQQTISPDSGKVLESVTVNAMPTRFQGGTLSTRKNIDGWSDTWVAKTWSGLTSFSGENIWTDGDNIYYSSGTNQYVLDKSTSTWTAKTWSGLTDTYGKYFWSDGDNIYYSNGSNQFVLNKSTSTWTTKTWNGLTKFNGSNVWSDGDNIYYSNQYVLDKSTSTWSAKTWSGLTSFAIAYIWTDGINIYYSSGTKQYVLDKSTSTWSAKTWSGLTSFNGNNVWTDGTNIYYSGVYVLTKTKTHWLV